MKMKEKTREELLEQLADIRFGIIFIVVCYVNVYLSTVCSLFLRDSQWKPQIE